MARVLSRVLCVLRVLGAASDVVCVPVLSVLSVLSGLLVLR